MRMNLFFLQKPFIWCILITIYIAYLYPNIGCKGGVIKPEITVKYIAVMLIFFISGFSLKTEELKASIWHYHLHIFIQCFSMVFVPVVVQFFLITFGELYSNSDLLKGFLILSCMPVPVSSAVILTKSVGGNEAAAVFNSALGSLLGIFVTPLLLFTFLGSSSSVPLVNAFVQLAMTIILPVFGGQIMRSFYKSNLVRQKKFLSSISSGMLLLIIYSTFCETFSQSDKLLTLSTVLITIATVFVLQSFLMSIVFLVTTSFNVYFKPEDTISALFCATHKSLTLGFPLMKIMFESEATFHLISLPLLVYHPMQILLGSLMVPFLQTWLTKVQKKRHYLHSV